MTPTEKAKFKDAVEDRKRYKTIQPKRVPDKIEGEYF